MSLVKKTIKLNLKKLKNYCKTPMNFICSKKHWKKEIFLEYAIIDYQMTIDW